VCTERGGPAERTQRGQARRGHDLVRCQVRERVRVEEEVGRRVARGLGHRRGRRAEARERVGAKEALGWRAEDGWCGGRVEQGGRGGDTDGAEVDQAVGAGRVGRGRGPRRVRVLIGVEETGDEDGERAGAGGPGARTRRVDGGAGAAMVEGRARACDIGGRE
jgi:hypothetical protein